MMLIVESGLPVDSNDVFAIPWVFSIRLLISYEAGNELVQLDYLSMHGNFTSGTTRNVHRLEN